MLPRLDMRNVALMPVLWMEGLSEAGRMSTQHLQDRRTDSGPAGQTDVLLCADGQSLNSHSWSDVS